jgi:hypothetical protein
VTLGANQADEARQPVPDRVLLGTAVDVASVLRAADEALANIIGAGNKTVAVVQTAPFFYSSPNAPLSKVAPEQFLNQPPHDQERHQQCRRIDGQRGPSWTGEHRPDAIAEGGSR